MGLVRRLLQARASVQPATAANRPVSNTVPGKPARNASHVRPQVTYSSDGDPALVQLTGTTTVAKQAVTALASRHGIADCGYLEADGRLQREANNKVDPRAVAVHVEGERIGYLPAHLAAAQHLAAGEARHITVQIFTELLPTGLRGEAWAWLGTGQPRWAWSATNRPPISPQAKAQARHASSNAMVREALAQGGNRAEQFRAGMVNGVHYLQLIEPIKQLKRDGRLEEALSLCYAAIEGAEADRDGHAPAPWYTEQAAIIHRKRGQRDEEIAVLNRWLKLCPAEHRDGSRIAARLAKLTR